MLESRELKEKYGTYSNKDLIRILRYRTDYTQQAVSVIQDVVNQREIAQKELDQILDELNEEQKEHLALAEENLTYWEKLLLVCVPILGFALYLVFTFKNRKIRYTPKIKKSLTYSLLGTIILGVLLIVVWYK